MKLRADIELEYEGEDEMMALGSAITVLKSAERAMSKLGFTGWSIANLKVVKPPKKKRAKR